MGSASGHHAQIDGEKWVFGYGSLMWRPGFAFAACEDALTHGYHRSLCVYSHVHRGTPERPGLVLGLDRGGACRGVAYRVEDRQWEETVAYLRAREQATGVYLETALRIILPDGRARQALAYTIDRKHFQYAGRLSLDDMLRIVNQGVGQSGANPEYVLNTAAHLAGRGVHDRLLSELSARLRRQN
ncbi:MAG: gamma-glutamylcyclotransferase [Beijerinckiaceae bacterium]|nr:gamma-glutamylcyclotransferase [Beijerinckiaceae bacterium]